MADYFNHWIHFREKLGYLAPKIFYVNWFRQNASGKFIWPGYGENSRVLKWITERVDGTGGAHATPLGYLPTVDALDTAGIDITAEEVHTLLQVDTEAWLKEIPEIRKYYAQFGDRLPPALLANLANLESRLHGSSSQTPTQNQNLLAWVESLANLCAPEDVHWCTGTDAEYNFMCDQLTKKGTLQRLNPAQRPNSFVARTHPDDTDKIDEVFVCSETEEEVGVNCKWANSKEMKDKMQQLFKGCMKGRTMYVVPYCLGPLESKWARVGVQVTDSPYAVLGLRAMTRMGSRVLNFLSKDQQFIKCVHSVGSPLEAGKQDVPWPCNLKDRVVAQFSGDAEVWSYGSGFADNSVMTKTAVDLRLASVISQDQKWLVSRCAVISVTPPNGPKHYVAAVLPVSAGRTSMSMMVPKLPGWNVQSVADDVAWLHVGRDGRLYAINPENGFLGAASGRSGANDPGILQTIASNTIFTNVATTAEGDVWWEGLTKDVPAQGVTDWTGQPWTSDCGRPASHPNSRYLTPHSNSPCMDPDSNHPNGVPISAIIFGSRRSETLPLVSEAYHWTAGLAAGASVSAQQSGSTEPDYFPFAITLFCGIDFKRYIAQWEALRDELGYNLPKVFTLNGFRTLPDGSVGWPGYGDNARLFKWIWQRIEGYGEVVRTPVGFVPPEGCLDLKGLTLSPESIAPLLSVNESEWQAEIQRIKTKLADHKIPSSLLAEFDLLLQRFQTRKDNAGLSFSDRSLPDVSSR